MKTKILIEKNALTVQLAIIREDEFVAFHVYSLFEQELQNKIIIGEVKQIVKNLKAVFVDYGDKKNGMLHLKQIPDYFLKRVQVGSLLPVQIVKQNTGEKGHRLTSKLNLSGHYLVCLPFEPGINISKKITDEKKRKFIKEQLGSISNKAQYGFIVRTHAEHIAPEKLKQEAEMLVAKVNHLLQIEDYLTKESVLYEEPNSICQIILDQLSFNKQIEIISQNQDYLEELKQVIRQDPRSESAEFICYEDKLPIWSYFGLSKKIEELTKRKVWLKNGGNLMIDYTEAMTVIDVNSAKAILTKNPEKAVLKLNTEAVEAAILQMLRRNLVGMVLIDLVEMKHKEHKKIVYETAQLLLEKYGESRTKVYPLTELGLLQFSRGQKYPSLAKQLTTSCTCCGMVGSYSSFLKELMEVENQLKTIKLSESRQQLLMQVSPAYYDQIISRDIVSILEASYPVVIKLTVKPIEQDRPILCQFYTK